MSTDKKVPVIPDMRNIPHVKLPFDTELATRLLTPQFNELVQANFRCGAPERQSFGFEPNDKALVPEELFDTAWGVDCVVCKPFTWCGLLLAGADGQIAPNVPGHFWPAGFTALVKPTSYDDIYVIDGDAEKTAHDALARRTFAENREATREEVQEIYHAVARTFVKVTDYRPGSYENPVVLVARKLNCFELLPLPV